MKKYMLLLSFTFLGILGKAQNWVYSSSFSGAYAATRWGGISVSVGTKAYVGLGINTSGSWNFLKDFWEYNTVTNTWTRLTDFPGSARYDAMAFAIGPKIYVGGGDSKVKTAESNLGIYLSDFYVFDTQTGTWSGTTSFPSPRGEAAAFSIGGKGYISCGRSTNGNFHSDLWSFDPLTSTWTRLADMPGGHGRVSPIGFAINGKAYVGAGYAGNWWLIDPPVFPTWYSDFWEYTPTANIWVSKGNTPDGSSDGTANFSEAISVSYCNKGYVIGGPLTHFLGGGYSDKVFEYNATSNSWTQLPSFPSTNNSGEGWIINGYLYAGLGKPTSGLGAKFYSYSLHNITTPSEICTTGTLSFQNPTASSTVSWVSGNTSALTISPSTGTSVTSTRVNNFNNEVTVTATMNGPSGCAVTRTKPVWLGVPSITNQKVDGGFYFPGLQICPGSHYLNVTPKGGNASVATWTVQGGVPYVVGTNTLNFTFISSLSSVAITARSTNLCGPSGNTSFYLTKKTFGCPPSFSLGIFPNPVQDELTIEVSSLNSDPAISDQSPIINEAILVNKEGEIVATSTQGSAKVKINVRGLPKGQYFLHVQVGKEIIAEQILVN